MCKGGRDQASCVKRKGVLVELVIEGSGSEDEGWQNRGERSAPAVGEGVRNGLLSGREGVCSCGVFNRRRGHICGCNYCFCATNGKIVLCELRQILMSDGGVTIGCEG